jgi:long-subunit acyl-CoA synthetase (AMP-forming)
VTRDTIVDRLMRHARERVGEPALVFRRDGRWASIDWDTYARRCRQFITSGGKNVAPQNIEKLLRAIDGIGVTSVAGAPGHGGDRGAEARWARWNAPDEGGDHDGGAGRSRSRCSPRAV